MTSESPVLRHMDRLTDEELKENEVFSMSSQLRWFDGELQQAWFGIQTGRVRWEPVPSFVRVKSKEGA